MDWVPLIFLFLFLFALSFGATIYFVHIQLWNRYRDWVAQGKPPIRIKTYALITATHIFFIDLAFAQIVDMHPEWAGKLYYVNMAYLILVFIHGIHYGSDKIAPIFKMALQLKPYWEEVTKRNIKGCLTPDKFGEVLDRALSLVKNQNKDPGPNIVVTGSKSLQELQKELCEKSKNPQI